MIKYYPEVLQGSEEWFAVRCGVLTASEMENIITPKKLEPSKQAQAHMFELLAQRVNSFVEPSYISNDMLRGQEDEPLARAAYEKRWGGTKVMGFVTNNKWGFTLGCSPDWLVNDDGGAQCKSRCQALQMETIVTGEVPDKAMLQIQTELLVTERKWWDYVSYSGGMVMKKIRVEPVIKYQDAILTAAQAFEEKLKAMMRVYTDMIAADQDLIPTERRNPNQEMKTGEFE